MKKIVLTLCATAAMALAAPAYAATTPTSCGATTTPDFTVTGVPSGAMQACVGYYSNNLLNSSNETQQRDALAALLLTPAGQASGIATPASVDWNALVAAGNTYSGAAGNISGNVFNFGRTLYGETIIGMHYGNVADPADPYNNSTAFYLFDFGTTGATGLSFSPSARGWSNAAIYATGVRGAVPEPATWAMMLLGFGGIGMASRRRRAQVLPQIA